MIITSFGLTERERESNLTRFHFMECGRTNWSEEAAECWLAFHVTDE